MLFVSISQNEQITFWAEEAERLKANQCRFSNDHLPFTNVFNLHDGFHVLIEIEARIIDDVQHSQIINFRYIK